MKTWKSVKSGRLYLMCQDLAQSFILTCRIKCAEYAMFREWEKRKNKKSKSLSRFSRLPNCCPKTTTQAAATQADAKIVHSFMVSVHSILRVIFHLRWVQTHQKKRLGPDNFCSEIRGAIGAYGPSKTWLFFHKIYRVLVYFLRVRTEFFCRVNDLISEM